MSEMLPLQPADVRKFMEQLPQWHLTQQESAIERTCSFASFDAAMAFVNAVADRARIANHHPDIAISFRTVTITLTTHRVNGLTEKDMRLAESIDLLSVSDVGDAKSEPYVVG